MTTRGVRNHKKGGLLCDPMGNVVLDLGIIILQGFDEATKNNRDVMNSRDYKVSSIAKQLFD